ncbi:unnamed protein product [Timema podura]|uniref:Uncharacterized protein n=1 Tax=Timema podura TaxID=61482 RepID=A0ABN7NUU3_TIMPD|nr:unnamed protein product [Timema podura]
MLVLEWLADDGEIGAAEELGRSRQRLATPSPSPSPLRTHESMTTLTRINNEKNKENNWFKSLDRLTKKNKSKAKTTLFLSSQNTMHSMKTQTQSTGCRVPPATRGFRLAGGVLLAAIDNIKEATTEDEMQTRSKHHNLNSSSNKSLRFFGDTDQESVKSAIKHQPIRRYKSNNTTVSSNKLQVPQRSSSGGLRNHHRHHRSAGDVATSSAESTTEGDSSQQSQRSVVYLHAATVGDIPGPGLGAKSQRRAQSREELSSVASSRLQPQTRTVSRSISVLAPWKPKHYREGMDVHYDNESSGRGNGKPPKVPATNSSTINRGTARRRNDETARPSFQKQKVNKAMSVESLSHRDSPLGTRNQNKDTSSSKKRNLSTSVESLTYKNGAPTRNQQNKVASKKSNMLNSSAMDLNSNKSYKNGSSRKIIEGKKASSNLNRSASMPKDTRTSGWFKLRNKK